MNGNFTHAQQNHFSLISRISSKLMKYPDGQLHTETHFREKWPKPFFLAKFNFLLYDSF